MGCAGFLKVVWIEYVNMYTGISKGKKEEY